MKHRLHPIRLIAIAAIGITAACGDDSDGPAGTGGQAVVLVGAGDIARCGSDATAATAALLDDIPGVVFTTGDNAADDGSLASYEQCYDPTWGRHKSRTRPAPGNHDYSVPGAAGYFQYFGDVAGDPPKGYYSYDVGDWHIVVLNSVNDEVDTSRGSEQEQWLRADLAATDKECVLAYWHHPRFYSHASWTKNFAVMPFWQALYEAGAEIVVNGHFHLYERYAPQDPDGGLDVENGIRQFTVGTGGHWLYDEQPAAPNIEARNNDTYGVLKLTLERGGYAWEFIPAAGGSFTDSGRGTCH